jgi:hypothetical protein
LFINLSLFGSSAIFVHSILGFRSCWQLLHSSIKKSLYEFCHFNFFSTTTNSHHTIAPFELARNFKFKPPYPFPLPQQGEVSPSSSSTPPIVLSNDSPFAIMCDSALENATKENPTNKNLCEGAKQFQDGWTIRLPWGENVIDHKDLVHQVQSQVCIMCEGKKN